MIAQPSFLSQPEQIDKNAGIGEDGYVELSQHQFLYFTRMINLKEIHGLASGGDYLDAVKETPQRRTARGRDNVLQKSDPATSALERKLSLPAPSSPTWCFLRMYLSYDNHAFRKLKGPWHYPSATLEYARLLTTTGKPADLS